MKTGKQTKKKKKTKNLGFCESSYFHILNEKKPKYISPKYDVEMFLLTF